MSMHMLLMDVVSLHVDVHVHTQAHLSARPSGQECDVQPVLLEINYSADYGKMLDLRPGFVNEAFARLFHEAEDESSALWDPLL